MTARLQALGCLPLAHANELTSIVFMIKTSNLRRGLFSDTHLLSLTDERIRSTPSMNYDIS